ncbi:leucine-rich repeat domain-containing protein [Seonamhaeicola aphaedonensis]|uniref:Leucine rich repeat (LRR) protein n=1 Tax=Seonamhaeicola aphaedonensis TaxID=1461338 RepID=A0A3D9H815_9FLAO|nr:hypothetical protein [Seonamhaeicola aphaedonensis]RED45635.1 hypothetical protein DFQ02_10813 [Seonamhaeicola aphaedonensis]
MKVERYKDLDYEYLRIDSSKMNDYINYINKNDIKNLDINSISGYRLKDVNFLEFCPNIEVISITDRDIDIEGIKHLKSLRVLTSNSNPISNFDLSIFPNLESLSVDWNGKWSNITECLNLKSLRVWSYKEDDLMCFKKLEKLKILSLNESSISSLSGIEKLKSLTKFEGYYLKKLSQININKEIDNLKEIHLEYCKKIENFQDISKIKGLRKLSLIFCSQKIKSVSFIEKLPYLVEFNIKGTTIEDGDTSFFSRLQMFYFDNKKDYNYSYKELILPKLKQKANRIN